MSSGAILGGVDPLALHHLARARAGAADYDGELILATWPDAPLNGGQRPAEALAAWLVDHPELADAVCRADPEGPPPGAAPLSLMSADHILTTEWPDPVWAVPNLLPSGLTILAGRPKVGKSWMALQIALAVAAGGIALGERVKAGPVLYLALEDPPRRLKGRMEALRWPIGLPAEFMPLGEFDKQIGDLRDGGGERLALQIERRGYRLVVIDTLSRAVYGDQRDEEEMTQALTPLQEMAHDLNCAAVLVDHHRKGFGADPDAVGDILGSTAKGAMADCVWGLYKERGKAGAKLAIVGRDVEERTLALSWDGLGSCWQCEGDAYELELTERREEILQALILTGRVGLQEIADAVGQPRSNTHNRLQDLVSAGLVQRLEEGRRVYYVRVD